MTATASNGMVYEGKKYSITNCTELIRFRPDDYGIKARLFTSANHFGFSCNYEIVDGGLRVRDVVTWNPEGDYPPLNGREPSRPEGEFDDCVYRDIGLSYEYSGVLALADRDSYLGYYIHMGRQPMFCWERVVGVAFGNGRVTDVFDLSDISKCARMEYESAASDREKASIRASYAWHFGCMSRVDDERRLVVDSHYAPRFHEEQASVSDSLHGRLPIGQPRGRFIWVYCPIPYVPLGCTSELIDRETMLDLLRRFVDGTVVREDAERASFVLSTLPDGRFGHFSTDGRPELLRSIARIIRPRYDERIDFGDAPCNVYHNLDDNQLARLRQLIELAF